MALGPIHVYGPCSLIMDAPSYVLTLDRVAKMLGEDEERLYEIAMDMELEEVASPY